MDVNHEECRHGQRDGTYNHHDGAPMPALLLLARRSHGNFLVLDLLGSRCHGNLVVPYGLATALHLLGGDGLGDKGGSDPRDFASGRVCDTREEDDGNQGKRRKRRGQPSHGMRHGAEQPLPLCPPCAQRSPSTSSSPYHATIVSHGRKNQLYSIRFERTHRLFVHLRTQRSRVVSQTLPHFAITDLQHNRLCVSSLDIQVVVWE